MIPGAAFVAPNAPDRVPGAPSGFQWFPISRIDPHEMQGGVAMAAPRIGEFLDAELARLGLAARTAGAGRLQPGRNAGAASGTAARPCRDCGLFRSAGRAAARRKAQSRPILLTHGGADEVIPGGRDVRRGGKPGGGGVRGAMASGAGAWATASTEKGLSLAGNFLALAWPAGWGRKGRVCCPL